MANVRVRVPTKGYDHTDGNASEQLSNGCWLAGMNDGTQVWLCGVSLQNFIDAHKAGRLTFNDDGTIKSYTPLP